MIFTGLLDTPKGERFHIAFFGMRNAGKSSLVNAFTGQSVSVVSDVKGTTTDVVTKTMELLPIGPVVIIDTPGFDDEGALGELRVKQTLKALENADAAVLVTDASRDLSAEERELISLFDKNETPHIVVKNKCDLTDARDGLCVSALTGEGIDELKTRISTLKENGGDRPLLGDLISPGETVLLITPIDSAAPKGRMILPQQQAIREALDCGARVVVVRENEIKGALDMLKTPPSLAVTDSQAFAVASRDVPGSVPLTSFSILMARKKGFLADAVKGVGAIKRLKDGDRILVAEGCTHRRQCGDIGTVKIPALVRKFTGADVEFVTASGGDFEEKLNGVSLVMHCGGCMNTAKQLRARRAKAAERNIPFTNYGTAIAYMNGILRRALSPLEERKLLDD